MIGELAKKYDVCTLQEVWGPGTDIIEKSLENTHHTHSFLKGDKSSFAVDFQNTLLCYQREVNSPTRFAPPFL